MLVLMLLLMIGRVTRKRKSLIEAVHRKTQNNKLRIVKSAGLSCGDDGGYKTPGKRAGWTSSHDTINRIVIRQ
jgi:hypothetical protein